MVRKTALLEGNTPSQMSTPNLDEKIRLRSPYVAPLNVLQVRWLYGGKNAGKQKAVDSYLCVYSPQVYIHLGMSNMVGVN